MIKKPSRPETSCPDQVNRLRNFVREKRRTLVYLSSALLVFGMLISLGVSQPPAIISQFTPMATPTITAETNTTVATSTVTMPVTATTTRTAEMPTPTNIIPVTVTATDPATPTAKYPTRTPTRPPVSPDPNSTLRKEAPPTPKNKGGSPLDAIPLDHETSVLNTNVTLGNGQSAWFAKNNLLAHFSLGLTRKNGSIPSVKIYGPEQAGGLLAWAQGTGDRVTATGQLGAPGVDVRQLYDSFWTGASKGTVPQTWYILATNLSGQPVSFQLVTADIPSNCDSSAGKVHESLDGGRSYIDWQLCNKAK